ncbi:hypothetical protein M0R36_10800 [bacterium]|nr:hypothetical protein [bacterium]
MTEMTDETRKLSSKCEIDIVFKDKRGCVSGLWNYIGFCREEEMWELYGDMDRMEPEGDFTHFGIISKE